MIDLETSQICCVVNDSGRRHDFKVFVNSKVRFHSDTESLQDSGYQGIAKFYANNHLPKKKPKAGKLRNVDKRLNRDLASRQVVVEHVNRRLQVFRILSQRYRNCRKRFVLRCHLIAGIYNYERQMACSVLENF